MGGVGAQVFRGVLWATGLLLVAVVTGAMLLSFSHREENRRYSCLSNMKCMALSVLEYAADSDGHLPPAPRVPFERSLEDGKPRTWSGDLSGYFPPDEWHRRVHFDNNQVFVCPSTRSIYSYDFNSRVYGAKLEKLEDPDKTVMEFEQGFLTGSPPGPHMKGYNTTYCDGRGAWVPHAFQPNGEILLH